MSDCNKWPIAIGGAASGELTVRRGAVLVDLTNAAITGTLVKRNEATGRVEGAALATISVGDGITITDAVNGKFAFTFSGTDTQGLTEGQEYLIGFGVTPDGATSPEYTDGIVSEAYIAPGAVT